MLALLHSKNQEFVRRETVFDLKHVIQFAYVVACVLLATAAYAQRSSELSADIPDARTLETQRKVESLFDNQNYDRAFFIYRNELVPVGDKYAQYMVGFMYMTGLGVEEDVVTASAWYRLAAERDTPEFVAVRDRLMRVFTDEQLRLSDARFSELRSEYSDIAVLMASIKRDVNELQSRTGSRLRGEASPLAVIDGRSGRVSSGDGYFGTIERQIEHRLELLRDMTGSDDIAVDARNVDIRRLERIVRDAIALQSD